MKQHIKTVKEFNQWRTTGEGIQLGDGYPKRLSIALDEVVKAAERYEYIRTLNARQFADLCKRNIAGEGRFDDLVDAMIKGKK